MQLLDPNDPKVKKVIGRIRVFMKDFAHKNDLIVEEEASDDELLVFLELSIDDYNTTTPKTSHTISNFPSFFLLLYGTVIQALFGEALHQIRNRLNYTDGGITVGVSDKAGDYMQAAQGLMAKYESKKLELKKSLNAEGSYGDVPSEYSTTDFWF